MTDTDAQTQEALKLLTPEIIQWASFVRGGVWAGEGHPPIASSVEVARAILTIQPALDRLLGSLTDARRKWCEIADLVTDPEEDHPDHATLLARLQTEFAHGWHEAGREMQRAEAAEAALADAQRERAAMLGAIGEPCAECDHVDWRADPNEYLDRIEAAEARVETLQAALRGIEQLACTYNRLPDARETCGCSACSARKMARAALREQHRETPPPENMEARSAEERPRRAGGES